MLEIDRPTFPDRACESGCLEPPREGYLYGLCSRHPRPCAMLCWPKLWRGLLAERKRSPRLAPSNAERTQQEPPHRAIIPLLHIRISLIEALYAPNAHPWQAFFPRSLRIRVIQASLRVAKPSARQSKLPHTNRHAFDPCGSTPVGSTGISRVRTWEALLDPHS